MQSDIMKCLFLPHEALIFMRCDVWYKNAMRDCVYKHIKRQEYTDKTINPRSKYIQTHKKTRIHR